MPNKIDCKCAVFDMDGTLIDSSAEIAKCLKKSYADAGIDVTYLDFSAEIVGPPIRGIIGRITPNLDAQTVEKIAAFFRLNYDDSPDDISTIYAGMESLLCLLKGAGKSLYIATNKPIRATMRIVKDLNLDCFDGIYTIDKFGERMSKSEMLKMIADEEQIAPCDIAMIGDSADDIKNAKLAGAQAIAALWGYGDSAELLKIADAAFASADELSDNFSL